MEKVPVLILIGPTGVGKTAVSDAISEILAGKDVPHALIDMDHLRYAFPRPKDDPFFAKLGYKNLASVWKNYQEVGAKCVVMPNVFEKRSSLSHIAEAIPGSVMTVVRLRASVSTIHERLRGREKSEKSLAWHMQRAEELNDILEEAHIEDFVVETEGKSIQQVAEEVLKITFWPTYN